MCQADHGCPPLSVVVSIVSGKIVMNTSSLDRRCSRPIHCRSPSGNQAAVSEREEKDRLQQVNRQQQQEIRQLREEKASADRRSAVASAGQEQLRQAVVAKRERIVIREAQVSGTCLCT